MASNKNLSILLWKRGVCTMKKQPRFKRGDWVQVKNIKKKVFQIVKIYWNKNMLEAVYDLSNGQSFWESQLIPVGEVIE